MNDFFRGRPFELSAEQRKELSRYVDQSPYAMAEWEQSLQLVFAWLAQRGRNESYERVVGYVICCAEVGAREPVLRAFPLLVREMLTTHGVD